MNIEVADLYCEIIHYYGFFILDFSIPSLLKKCAYAAFGLKNEKQIKMAFEKRSKTLLSLTKTS